MTYRFVCSLILYCDEKDIVLSILENSPFSRIPISANFFGDLTSDGKIYRDPDTMQPAIYFLFDNFNIKAIGNYRICCQVVELN